MTALGTCQCAETAEYARFRCSEIQKQAERVVDGIATIRLHFKRRTCILYAVKLLNFEYSAVFYKNCL